MPPHPENTERDTPVEPAPKAPWHPPAMEEVEYSATEAAGSGATYDLTVYTGSV
jgi:hypothetical protein